jgi:putative membrane protein
MVMRHGPGFMLFSGLHIFVWLIVAAVVVLLVIWAVRSSARPMYWAPPPSAPAPQRETPLDILARRFAAGEITAEEYERGRNLLGGGKT